jgi:hypothetical protein
MIGRLARAVLVLTAALGAAATAVPAVAAAPSGAAYLRVAHFSPDTPSVDVYLTSFAGGTQKLWLAGVGYGAVGPYRRLDAGEYAVSLRPHGAAASTPPVLTRTLRAEAGHAYTAAGVGLRKNLRAVVLSDDLSSAGPGRAKVRLIEASERAGVVEVRAVSGPTLASGVRFGTTTGYRTFPAGTWRVLVSGGGLSTDATLSLRPDSIMSVVVLDAKQGNGLAVTSVLDAAGAAAMPSGAVPAGGGGTAPHASGGLFSGGLIALLLAAAGATLLGRRRAR